MKQQSISQSSHTFLNVMLWAGAFNFLMGCVFDEAPAVPSIFVPGTQDQTLKEISSMTHASPYSEAAWNQWHSTRLDACRSLMDGCRSWDWTSCLRQLAKSFRLGGDGDISPDGFKAKLGQLELRQDGWWFRVETGTKCTWNGQQKEEGILQTDAEAQPTTLRVGGGILTLIERGGRVALRSRHPDARSRVDFSGIPCWPWQEDAIVKGTFLPAQPGRTFQYVNALGETEENALGGSVRFTWPSVGDSNAEAATHELIGSLNGDGSLWVVFSDATSGDESYGGGRFLSISAPDGKGEVVIDFNRSVIRHARSHHLRPVRRPQSKTSSLLKSSLARSCLHLKVGYRFICSASFKRRLLEILVRCT